jgi:MobA/MobL family
MALDNAPAWMQHAAREARQRAWNEAERADPNPKARLATELQFALPHELTDAQRKQLVYDSRAPAEHRRNGLELNRRRRA